MNKQVYVLAGVALIALINCAATHFIIRDRGLTSIQRLYQVLLVWVLPLVGAAVTYFFRRFTSAQQTHHNIFDSQSVDGEGPLSNSQRDSHSGIGHHD